MEAKFQIFLILLAVLAGTALLARRINIAPAILLLLAGIALAFVPGMPAVELPPELVLLRGAAAADLFGQRRHELARVQIQPAPDHPAVGRLRDLHRLRGRRRDALPDRAALERRLPAGRDRRAAGRGGAAGDCPQARHAAPHPRRARGRGARQRRHRADPLPVRGGGDFDRTVLAAEGDRHLRGHRRRRDPVRRGGRLALPARAAPRARSAGRDHAVADHALSRLLDPRASRRLRRDRDRRLRALHQLERPAADLVRDAPAGHLLLGPRDLPDRGPAVPADRIPDAAAVREIEGVSAAGHPVRHRAGRRHRHRRALCLGLSRDLSAAAAQQASCANAIRRRPGGRRS